MMGVILGAALAAQAAAGQASASAGVPVELMVMREVTGDHAAPGTPVTLTVNKALSVPGGTIPYGTPAFGEVVSASHAGLAMHRGRIAIRLTRLVIGGRDVPIVGDYASDGRGGEGDGAVKVMLVPVYALFSPGNAGKVKAGQLIEGHLPADFRLDTPGMAPPAP